MSALIARQRTDDNPDDNHHDECLAWQPLGTVLRRLARRLDLSRERAVVTFEAAGINVEAE